MTDADTERSMAFLGRERELDTLREDIARAGLDTLSGRPAARSRVLVIAGRAGSGRTAVAEELVRRVAGDYPDGVLRAVLDADAPRRLLGDLGMATAPGAGEDELAHTLREALQERRVMVVLDRADGDPELLRAIVPDNHGCLVVAVAEGPLKGIPDVRPCTLGGLEPGDGVRLLAGYAGDTRIACDPEAAQALAEECAGHPAALTLAGGWLAARPEASVAHGLKQLQAITGEQPLHRAFRLAYEGQPADDAELLRLLAVAPAGLVDARIGSALAGCTLAAADKALAGFAAQGLVRAVPGADGLYEVPGCLQPLLESLVEAEEQPPDVLLARARMLEREVTLLGACHVVTEPADSPVHKALEGVPRTLRFGTVEEAGEWLRTRLPALLAAARSAVADGELDTLARRFIAGLSQALAAHRGAEAAAPELYRLHEMVLGVAERRGLHPEKAAALLQLGDLDAGAGRTEAALGRYRESLTAARGSGQAPLIGRALESLGCTYQELGDYERAADWYGRALDLSQSGGPSADEARLRARLGAVYTHAAQYGQALREWRAAAAAYRRLKDPAGQARALSETARVQEYAGHPQDCLRTCEEALESARLAGDDRLRAAVQLRLADTLDRLGDPVAAGVQRSAARRLLGDEDTDAEEAPAVVKG